MIDPVSKAISKKNEAKNLRRSTPPEFEQAEARLKEAIKMLETVPLNPNAASLGTLEKSVAIELADCWGSLGGTYRASGQLPEAYECYSKGLHYEEDRRLPANSYNLVNRLLVRLAMNPAENEGIECKDGELQDLLQTVRSEVARQAKGPRKGDMWVHADDVLLNLLAGDRAGAAKAWEAFDRLAIVEYAYTTTRNALLDLSGRQSLTADQRDAIQLGVKWFEDAIQRKAWIKPIRSS